MKKSTIAVDLDDVLSAGAEGFVAFSNKKWGTNLKVEDYSERWSEMWQVNHEEEKRRAQEIYKSGTVKSFRHIKEAKPVLLQLSKRFNLVIATSRVKRVEKDTMNWVDRNFGGIFSEVHFSGIYDNLTFESHLLTKAELVKEVGAEYLIDDHPKHCLAVAEAGIEAILFGDYPWNRQVKLPKGVTRCKNWAEVLEYFDGRS